jgi:hypothetical protein
MRRLKSLLHRNQSAAWQDTVLTRLDQLTESQNQIRKELAEIVEAAHPTPHGRLRAFAFLAVTVALITTAVSATIISSTFKDQATTALNQAQTASEQFATDFQPIENIVNKHGAEYLYTHPSKSILSDLQKAQGPAQQVSNYNAEANHYDFKYVASEYFGQIILAISSACFGAIAGWLLIPLLVEHRSRRRS